MKTGRGSRLLRELVLICCFSNPQSGRSKRRYEGEGALTLELVAEGLHQAQDFLADQEEFVAGIVKPA